MKCPHCGNIIAGPIGWNSNASGIPIIILTCPLCQAILGAVNKPKD